MIVYLDLKIIYKEKAIRMRIKERLLQYKQELQKQTMYKEGLPGSSLDIVNTLLNDLKQDEKENGWIPVKYHQISEKERAEEFLSKDIQYMLDCKMPDDGQEILVTNGETTCKIRASLIPMDIISTAVMIGLILWPGCHFRNRIRKIKEFVINGRRWS